MQAQQDALVADQAQREAELLRKQEEAQDRKNRAAGAGGSGSSSDGSSSDGGKPRGGKRSSSSSQDSQGCTKPDYSGMSRKEKRAAKKAYEKCRKAGDSTSYDSAGDSSGDSGAVTTKSLQRGSKGVRATFHYCESLFHLFLVSGFAACSRPCWPVGGCTALLPWGGVAAARALLPCHSFLPFFIVACKTFATLAASVVAAERKSASIKLLRVGHRVKQHTWGLFSKNSLFA